MAITRFKSFAFPFDMTTLFWESANRETSSCYPVIPLWCLEWKGRNQGYFAHRMTFLVLTVLAELVCWGSLSAFGQTRSRDEPTLEGETFSEEEKQSAVKKRTEGDTKFVPSVTFSQRYDSNVLFAPSGSKVGLTPWDFVTTASPTIQLLNRNRYAESSLLAGVSGNLFVNNSDLNFVSTNLTG